MTWRVKETEAAATRTPKFLTGAPDIVVGASNSEQKIRRTSVGLGDLRKALHSLSFSVASSLK